MSLYFVPGEISEIRLQSVARELIHPSKSVAMQPGAAGWLWVDDEPERFGPAVDNATGVRAISSGRLVWSAYDWSRAKRLPYSGGLANRLVLERYLARGAATVAPYNGAAVIAIHDPRNGKVHIWTDQFGYHPCFIYRSDRADQCIVTTFPDALLADPAASLTYDLVSMAEFVRAWRATPPNTYFTEVKHAGAATHVTIDTRAGRMTRQTYWVPFRNGFFPSIDAAAEELSAAVKSAISERTAVARRPLVFISGGADSRVLLFGAADPSRVVAINIYEHAGADTDIARNLCAAVGCRFVVLQRDNDYYPRHLPDFVRWSGGMWSVVDSHFSGLAERLADFNPDLVMTACSTDWLFKGLGLEKEHVPFLGRSLPFLRYVNKRAEGFLPGTSPLTAPTHLAASINERMAAWFDGCPDQLATPLDRAITEDRRIRPFCYSVVVSGQIMYRTFPYDMFMADTRIAECYSRINPDWKLNREVWGKAAARICAAAVHIVDSNYGWRVNAGTLEKAIIFGRGWIGRRLASTTGNAPSLDNDRPPPAGSWPDYGWYAAHSSTLRNLWESITAKERARVEDITGMNPWRKPLDQWAADGFLLFRLLTLICHWRECSLRRQRAGLSPDVLVSVH